MMSTEQKNLVLRLDNIATGNSHTSEPDEEDSLYAEHDSSYLSVTTPVTDKPKDISINTPSPKLKNRVPTNKCPCGKSDTSSTHIICAKCKQSWHNKCANLTGLGKAAIKKLEIWQCPKCYTCPLLRYQPTINHAESKALPSSLQSDIKSMTLQMKSLIEKTTVNESLSMEVNALKTQLAELVSATKEPKPVTKVPPELDEAIMKLPKIETGLADLNEQILSLKSSMTSSTHKSPTLERSRGPSVTNPNTSSPNSMEAETPCEPFIKYQKDCIPSELKEKLLQHIDESESSFKSVGDGSREVLYYGAFDYSYSGVKHEKQPMPESIKALMETVNSLNIDEPLELNSCLVTKYRSGKNFIPFHRDDEPVIGPESKIVTVSIGSSRSMLFENNDKSQTKDLLLEDCSVLVTSRFAQDFWRHSIPKDESGGVRVSFTFRNISPYFLNSTKILGDSNSVNIKFGTGTGSLGAWVPGKREKVGHIEALPDATDIGPYRNLILHTGINSINTTYHKKSHTYLLHVLESKCCEYLKVYPKLKIYISTLLPTRIRSLNHEVEMFNRGILDICYRLKNTNVIDNSIFGSTLSNEHGRWNTRENRPLTTDAVHLGKKGIRMLAVNLKSAVLNKGRSQFRDRFNVGQGSRVL